MGLDCVITVKGRKNGGRRQHGNSDNDRTKKVEEFLVGSEVLYHEVFNHVKDCPRCDPQEVLEGYLSNRKKPKLGGLTSEGLQKLAEKYYKLAPGRVRRETVQEFYWRIGTVSGLARCSHLLSPDEMVSGILTMHRRWTEVHGNWEASKHVRAQIRKEVQEAVRDRNTYAGLFEWIFGLWQPGVKVLPDRTELRDLATVAYVLRS